VQSKLNWLKTGVRHVAQTYLNVETKDPHLNYANQIDFRLQLMIKSWKSSNPAPLHVKPIPIQVIQRVVSLSQLLSASDFLYQSTTDMIILAFFFLLWPLGWEFQFLVPISGTPIGSRIPILFLIPKILVRNFFLNFTVEKSRNLNSDSKIWNSKKKRRNSIHLILHTTSIVIGQLVDLTMLICMVVGTIPSNAIFLFIQHLLNMSRCDFCSLNKCCYAKCARSIVGRQCLNFFGLTIKSMFNGEMYS
jgi:hypothetical protein